MTRKPTLLWVSHMVPYPPKAGLLIRSYNLIKELSAYYSITLIALNQRSLIEPYFGTVSRGLKASNEELSKYCENVIIYDEVIENSTIAKIRHLSESLVMQNAYSTKWLWKEGFQKKLNDLLAAQKFDYHYFDTVCLADYLKGADLPPESTYLGHHNIESAMMKRRAEGSGSGLQRWIFKQEAKKLTHLERACDSLVAGHIVCSNDDKLLLDNILGHQRSTVVANGFDFSLSEGVERAPDPKKLLFIGTMDWYPNVDAIRYLLNDIWPKLMQSAPDYCIDIIGANPPDDIVALAETLSGVTVHGFVDDLKPFIEQAGLYLCPIRDGGGTKLKLVEAFAYRIPVIANEIACEGLETTDGKHVTYAETPEAYTDAILRLSQDTETATAMAEQAYEHALDLFSFKNVAERFHQYLSPAESERIHVRN